MFYIHQLSCIWPQQNFSTANIEDLNQPINNQLKAIEPVYDNIAPGVLRRMGKAVRMGVGAALPILKNMNRVDGIIIGTTDGGKEDSVKFLNQIVQYDEGLLTPINFVQSIPNSLAGQIGLLTNNHGYNNTHLHLGLAFEFAVIDADMLLNENPENNYLLGSVDDISISNHYFEDKGGWYKTEEISGKELYTVNSPGSIAGEAAVMFGVNGNKTNAIATLHAIDTLHSSDEQIVKEKIKKFIEDNLPAGEKIDLLLSGENGDNRLLKYYKVCESVMGDIGVARFKHMVGEFPSASAMGLWLCANILEKQFIPEHMIKYATAKKSFKNIFMYNTYKGIQHSFMLITA